MLLFFGALESLEGLESQIQNRSCKEKMMPLFLRNFSTPTMQMSCRLVSNYVSRMRHLLELKEDDEACRKALTSGAFLLFHSFSPLLQRSENKYTAPFVTASELNGILQNLNQKEKYIEESVLIGCTENHVPQFALDLGRIEKVKAESVLKGTFVDLRKAFFLLDGKDAPLLSQAQGLLRWHSTHLYCSRTGHPTQKNVSGSKRVCSTEEIIYYPQKTQSETACLPRHCSQVLCFGEQKPDSSASSGSYKPGCGGARLDCLTGNQCTGQGQCPAYQQSVIGSCGMLSERTQCLDLGRERSALPRPLLLAEVKELLYHSESSECVWRSFCCEPEMMLRSAEKVDNFAGENHLMPRRKKYQNDILNFRKTLTGSHPGPSGILIFFFLICNSPPFPSCLCV
ncbi:nucleoside diphosphate-linked moiety X motif 13 isoform X1 [Scyliorhinus canicula]|uniref:nucleoside diphosphate-linked moiety X motif 13 isoform X1 n=1 Tax=Scyliorhinus canicula TaxID=7830 RepID=UPI0018F42DC1|nr:nucleoside diphosphate-linked moiety X motif 13 isoform X1 [Scyliorhinus canicula]